MMIQNSMVGNIHMEQITVSMTMKSSKNTTVEIGEVEDGSQTTDFPTTRV